MSAEHIDKKRCWKQVLEANYIILSLQGEKRGWNNHPAVKMWNGCIPALKEYYNAFLIASLTKHKIKTLKELYEIDCSDMIYPWWLGNEDFHRAMRSRLIDKLPEFYLPLFPDDKGFNNGKYFWPVMDTKTFKTI